MIWVKLYFCYFSSSSRTFLAFLFICCSISIINSSLIIFKKVKSRSQVQPIPQPNMLQLSQSQNTLSESQESMGHLQENLELQPIASISRSINVAPINVEINEVPSNNCEIRTTSRSPVQPTSQFSQIPNSLHESPKPLEHLKETLVSQPHSKYFQNHQCCSNKCKNHWST